MARKLALAALFLTLSATASAEGFTAKHKCHKENRKHCVSAPEIDPGSAMAGLLLVAGGLAVLRGRRTTTPRT